MADLPETRYARSGDIHIAYQVVGDGPIDLVFVPGMFNHLELIWEEDWASRNFFSRLASFSRLILFDKRGTGLSDRDVVPATLEDRMDDVRAVMDAAGSESAVLLGYSEGGPMSVVYAGTYPARVSALVLAATSARMGTSPDYPCGSETEAFWEGMSALADADWGQGKTIEYLAPALAKSERARKSVARWERMSVNPSSMLSLVAWARAIDVRSALPSIRVPTLVIQRGNDVVFTPCHGRHLRDHIPGARYVEVPGGNHILWVDPDPVIDEIEEFVTGARAPIGTERVLTTVLFTDIVGSTDRALALGDQPWRTILDRHDAAVRNEIDRFRGRLVKTTGDGALATFDGPARAIRCAGAIQEAVGDLGLELRAGLHTGEVEVRGDDIGGIAVHIGQRVCGLAGPGEVLVSSTVKDLVVGSGISFSDRGTQQLRGISEEWRLYAATGWR